MEDAEAMKQESYDHDFFAWATENARLLREGRLSEIDVDHIAEELESMGRSERRQLTGRLSRLIAHLLKWQFQPILRSKSWKCSIKNQRIAISDLLADSPSLGGELESIVERAYATGVNIAIQQTGLDEGDSPPLCPYSTHRLLDDNFRPGE
jgi:hypothetical protein